MFSDITKKLESPAGQISMVLDTDAYNEIDDQFALVYAATAQRINLKAVYAAPFHNNRSLGPLDGMERSYEEIVRVLSLLSISPEIVHKGSSSFMTETEKPIESDAALHLINLSNAMPEGEILYVVAIGAITNVASALLIDPSLKDKVVVVWLGGHPLYWSDNLEFNLKQDPFAVQVVLDSQVPLVHVPCKNVAEHIKTTVPEIRELLRDTGEIGEYLLRIFSEYLSHQFAASKEIWDMGTIAWLLLPEAMPSVVITAPTLNLDDNLTWGERKNGHPYRLCTDANRDAIFGDFVNQLKQYASKTR